ncbi:uncharacterized protein ACNS7B_012808 isoform 1-T1 [Menidia menidia]
MSSVMDGVLLSLSSSSSLPSSTAATEKQNDASPKSDGSVPQSREEHKSTEQLWAETINPMGDRLLSTEEQVTLITESLTVTSTDQEKLLLLNKNTELRRVNKELMKLNEDWDQVYRSATLGLQNRLEALELENSAIKQLNTQLLLKAEQQQSAKEYYEQALMAELKKNQELQEYIRVLESRIPHPESNCTPVKQKGSFSAGMIGPCSTSSPLERPDLSGSRVSGYPFSTLSPASSSPDARWQRKSPGSSSMGSLRNSQQEVQDLKDQLEALKCQQTEIYEAEYQTEHKDHKHTQQENRRLRRKREEMCQQVALLQEQLKIYEDDFRRERSDKQVLQRLLLQKPPNKDLVLIHRCNNEQHQSGGRKTAQSEEKRKQHHPLCPKHTNSGKESD